MSVKIRFRIYLLTCEECQMQMQADNLYSDLKWYCLGCGKKVEVQVIVRRTKTHAQTEGDEVQERRA